MHPLKNKSQKSLNNYILNWNLSGIEDIPNLNLSGLK